MDLTGMLTRCAQAVSQKKQLSRLGSKLPAVLVFCLCCCMLWQCSTCLLKYLASPIGASVAFSQDLSQSPIAITLCSKRPNLTYANFPELGAVDVRQGPGTDWLTVWRNQSLAGVEASLVKVDNFTTIVHQAKPSLCKTIHVYESSPSELRLRHYYSNNCRQENMEA